MSVGGFPFAVSCAQMLPEPGFVLEVTVVSCRRTEENVLWTSCHLDHLHTQSYNKSRATLVSFFLC